MDVQKRTKMGIAAFIMKKGYTIEDLRLPDYVDIFNVLQHKENRYTCLIKAKYFKNLSQLAQKFNIDIIWDTPSIFTQDKMIVSVTGDEENLRQIRELFNTIGNVTKTSFVKSLYTEQSLLSCLTDKQKEILVAAKKTDITRIQEGLTPKSYQRKLG